MLETSIIRKPWQSHFCTTHWTRGSRLFQTAFSCYFCDSIIRFSSIVTESSISTPTEAQQCINHGIINRNIVKVQVKHRRHADMNTHFDWAGTRRQGTFQLAEGTIPRLALCRSPDTGWVFAVINSPRVRTAAMCFHCACLISFFHFF